MGHQRTITERTIALHHGGRHHRCHSDGRFRRHLGSPYNQRCYHPPVHEPRGTVNPIKLFGVDYNACNGILSAMTSSTVTAQPSAQPSAQPKKHNAKTSRKKGGRKKTTTSVSSSSLRRVMYATTSLAAYDCKESFGMGAITNVTLNVTMSDCRRGSFHLSTVHDPLRVSVDTSQ